MYTPNDDLKQKILYLNKVLTDKYRDILSLDKEVLKQFINKNVGTIKRIKRLSKGELCFFMNKGGILGVDGSNNRMGGAYPHYIEIYRGLAKSTIYKDQPIFKTDFYTPLYSEKEAGDSENPLEKDEAIRGKMLSAIELDVAIEGIERFKPHVVLMDGSLIRYHIESHDKWIKLREECEKNNIILIGVIKDIKTSIIGDLLIKDSSLSVNKVYHDRELLYGLLEYGEIVPIKPWVTKKAEEGLSSLFMRSSETPNVIGMDILDSQSERLENMARLVLSLTPRNGRGVPLWIDIVDMEVRIPDKMIRGLIESYLDRGIMEKLFISERDNRTM